MARGAGSPQAAMGPRRWGEGGDDRRPTAHTTTESLLGQGVFDPTQMFTGPRWHQLQLPFLPQSASVRWRRHSPRDGAGGAGRGAGAGVEFELPAVTPVG